MVDPHQEVQENLVQQSEELYALQAIYGEESCRVDLDDRRAEVSIPSAEDADFLLRIVLPELYPSASAPLAELKAPHLSEDLLTWALRELEEQFQPGEIVLYAWIEWLKEQEVLKPPAEPACRGEEDITDRILELEVGASDDEVLEVSEAERQRQSSLWQQAKLDAALRARVEKKLVHGQPFTERRSTFQGHLAPVASVEEVEQAMSVLLENGKIQRATHNIMAYRIFNEEKGSFLQDCDDDGESAAGGRLLHLLQIVQVRNVVVVVSRWYGGILLGPVRFTHINNAARDLLEQCGYIAKEGGSRKKGRSVK